MKTTIRLGSFETNSSSTHSLVMTTSDEYNKWQNGELYYSADAGKFMTLEEILSYYESYIDYDGVSFIAIDDSRWESKFIADSLNQDRAASREYGSIYMEDTGELNGVAAISFYLSTEF